MPGLGVIVNVLAIVVGSFIGLAVGRLIKKRVREGILQVQGLAVIVIGMMGSISALADLSSYPGALGRYAIVIFLISLIIGTLIGEALALETRLKHMGKVLQRYVQSKWPGKAQNVGGRFSQDKFASGFITASLVYCVGAMAVLGSIQDGLGNPDTLFIKALLDGTISVFFASTLGIGVMFSIIPLFIMQGSIALIAFTIGDVIPTVAITGLAAVGGVLIAGIGLNLATGLKLRIGNMLPAVFVALALVWVLSEVLTI